MKRLTLSALPLLAFAGALAGCSERSTPTAARARPLATTAALVDRPCAWSVTCHGRSILFANWSWTENGVAIASGSAICGADQTLSGSGVRPANANGFTAQVWDQFQRLDLRPGWAVQGESVGLRGRPLFHLLV